MARLIAFYRPWWLLLDGFRLAVRAAVEMRRNSFLWPAAMTLRWAIHLLLGSPWFAVLGLVLVVAGPTRDRFVYGIIACLVIEAVAQLARLSRHRYVIGLWTYRRTRSLYRRWPRGWGDYAGRTNQVQAATGSEPSTPVRWRPMVDHPRLSWLYLPVAPGVVEFIVGPPPDRTYTDLVTAAAAMAAKFSYVDSIEVDYPSDRSSLAVLTVTFTGRPPEQPTGPVLRLVDNPPSGELAS
jgi:hypothetical protein